MRLLLIFLFFSSCIPLRIAPEIEGDKVMKAKKFKKNLPRDYAFIFEDPKNANEFYYYVNIKYQRDHQNVEWNVPFSIDGEELFFSFYETEIPTKTLNLIPLAIDATLTNQGYDPMLEDFLISRVGNWYLVLTVSDSNMNDCLEPNYKYREKVLEYLRDLRVEYLTNQNYLRVLLMK